MYLRKTNFQINLRKKLMSFMKKQVIYLRKNMIYVNKYNYTIKSQD